MEVAMVFPRHSAMGSFSNFKPPLTSLFSESMVHHMPPSKSAARVSRQILLPFFFSFSDYFGNRNIISLLTGIFKDVLPFPTTRTNKLIKVAFFF